MVLYSTLIKMLKYNFEYDKLILKQIILLIPKNCTNLKTVLTPTLGLYGLDILNFISVYEKITSHITNDTVTPLKITITKIKTFEVTALTPYLGNLLSFYGDISHKLDYEILPIYKFFLLKSIILSSFFKPSLLLYKNIRNYILGFRTKKKLILNVQPIPINFTGYCDYGLVINFINVNNTHLDILKNLSILFELKISKINNYLFFGSYFRIKGNNYIIGSNYGQYFFKFLRNLKFSSLIGFLPLYFKYKNNLVDLNFGRNFFSVENFNTIYFLRLLFYQLTKIIKLQINHNITFLKLYANLSTVNKKN